MKGDVEEQEDRGNLYLRSPPPHNKLLPPAPPSKFAEPDQREYLGTTMMLL